MLFAGCCSQDCQRVWISLWTVSGHRVVWRFLLLLVVVVLGPLLNQLLISFGDGNQNH